MPTIPLYQRTILTAASGLADWTTSYVDCSMYKTVSFQVEWDGVAASSGEIFLEGANVNGALVQRFANADMDWWLNGALAAPVVTAVAGSALLVVENPMALHRLTYVWAAGGAAAQFRFFVNGRSV